MLIITSVSARSTNITKIRLGRGAEELSKSFNERGGIFVFLHIPKTGGSAVRSWLLDRLSNETSYLQIDSQNIDRASSYIGCWKGRGETKTLSDYCEHGTPNKTIVVYEAHGGPPCLFYKQLSENLGRWRDVAKKNQVPFFAFTMVREPISWYQSFYNYYVRGKRNATETDFFQDPHMKANMQCAELFGIQWRKVRPATQVSFSQCVDALALLKNQMDWVSTTDTISAELMPLISYLGGFENRKMGVIRPRHPSGSSRADENKLVLSKFSEKGKDLLRNWTEWDASLYEDIRRSYDFNNFLRDFLDAQGALHPMA